MLTPPLNQIPIIPDKLVGILDNQITKLLDSIMQNVTIAIQEAVVLPDDIFCDDPRLEALKKRIAEVQKLIEQLQQIVPIIDKITSGLNTIVGIANSIKALQLLNPVTATISITSELILAQNLTIANANAAVGELIQSLAPKIQASLTDTILSLVPVLNTIGKACNQNVELSGTQGLQNAINDLDYGDTIPGYPPPGWILISGSGAQGSPVDANGDPSVPPNPPSPYDDGDGMWLYSGEGYFNPNGISWGSEQSRIEDATIGTEFYTRTNVSIDDMKQHLDTINVLVENQQNLLTSLQEAPAQSFNGTTPPDANLGKIGDYYVDTANNKIYGPKINSGWPTPVNY